MERMLFHAITIFLSLSTVFTMLLLGSSIREDFFEHFGYENDNETTLELARLAFIVNIELVLLFLVFAEIDQEEVQVRVRVRNDQDGHVPQFGNDDPRLRQARNDILQDDDRVHPNDHFHQD